MIVQIKALVVTKKVARQLRVHHNLTMMDFNLIKAGFKAIGLMDLDNEYYVLVESKSHPEDVRLLHLYSMKSAITELFGIDPFNLHRIILS